MPQFFDARPRSALRELPAPKLPSRRHYRYGRSSISKSRSPCFTNWLSRTLNRRIGPSTLGRDSDEVGEDLGIVGARVVVRVIDHHQPQHQRSSHNRNAENPPNQLSRLRIGYGTHRSFPRYRKTASHNANTPPTQLSPLGSG